MNNDTMNNTNTYKFLGQEKDLNPLEQSLAIPPEAELMLTQANASRMQSWASEIKRKLIEKLPEASPSQFKDLCNCIREEQSCEEYNNIESSNGFKVTKPSSRQRIKEIRKERKAFLKGQKRALLTKLANDEKQELESVKVRLLKNGDVTTALRTRRKAGEKKEVLPKHLKLSNLMKKGRKARREA